DGKEKEYERQVGVTYDSLSVLLTRRGRHREALDLCRKAIAMNEPLLGQVGLTSDWQTDIAHAYYHHACAAAVLGRTGASPDEKARLFAEALASYNQATQIAEKLVRIDPSVIQWQHVLACACIDRAGLQIDRSCLVDARADLERSYERLVALLKTNPSDIQLRATMAMYWRNLGVIQHESGDLVNARNSFRQSCETFEKLLREQPTFNALTMMAATYNRRGLLEKEASDPATAIDCHQRGRELLQKVLTAQPDNWIARRELGGHWNNEGNALRKLGRLEEAVAAFTQAIDEQRRAL